MARETSTKRETNLTGGVEVSETVVGLYEGRKTEENEQ